MGMWGCVSRPPSPTCALSLTPSGWDSTFWVGVRERGQDLILGRQWEAGRRLSQVSKSSMPSLLSHQTSFKNIKPKIKLLTILRLWPQSIKPWSFWSQELYDRVGRTPMKPAWPAIHMLLNSSYRIWVIPTVFVSPSISLCRTRLTKLLQADLYAWEEVAVAFQGITEKTGSLPGLVLPSYPWTHSGGPEFSTTLMNY